MDFLRLKDTKPAASVVMLALWVLVCIVGSGLMTLPMVALMLPALLCYGALRAGRVTALACVLLAAATALSLAGGLAAGAVVALMLPALCYSLYSYDRRLPFWHSALICACMLLAGAMLCAALATYAVGGDLVGSLRDAMEGLLRDLPWADSVLAFLYSAGALTVPEAMTGTMAVGQTFLMTTAIREELIKQLLAQIENMQRIQMPMQIVSGAMLGGLMCVYLPRRYASRHAGGLDAAAYVPLDKWYIPVRLFSMGMVALAGMGALLLLSGAPGARQVFFVMVAGVNLVLVLQGIVVTNWYLKARHMRKGMRVAAIIVLYALQAMLYMFQVLLFIGFADQLFDFRGLRIPPKDTQDEEDPL